MLAQNQPSQPLQVLFRKAVSFIDTPRKHWPIVAKLYRWVLAGGPIEHQHIAEYNLARNLQEQGKYEEAIDHYEKAIAQKPDYGKALSNLGIVYCLLGRYKESEECYRRAIQLNERDWRTHCNLADLCLREERLAEARREVLLALDIEPDDPISIHTHAQILERERLSAEAEKEFRHALALAPESMCILEDFAEFLALHGKPKEAELYMEKARALKLKEQSPIAGAQEWVKRTESHFNQQEGDNTDVCK